MGPHLWCILEMLNVTVMVAWGGLQLAQVSVLVIVILGSGHIISCGYQTNHQIGVSLCCADILSIQLGWDHISGIYWRC